VCVVLFALVKMNGDYVKRYGLLSRSLRLSLARCSPLFAGSAVTANGLERSDLFKRF
jgi:hypothetical protein